jgi:hypothetical protein
MLVYQRVHPGKLVITCPRRTARNQAGAHALAFVNHTASEKFGWGGIWDVISCGIEAKIWAIWNHLNGENDDAPWDLGVSHFQTNPSVFDDQWLRDGTKRLESRHMSEVWWNLEPLARVILYSIGLTRFVAFETLWSMARNTGFSKLFSIDFWDGSGHHDLIGVTQSSIVTPWVMVFPSSGTIRTSK